MRTSTPATRRGLRLSASFFLAGVIVAFIRFFMNDGSNGALLFLFATLMVAAIAIYARVAWIERLREKFQNAGRIIDSAPTEHLASVHPIRTPEASDVA